MQTPCFQNVSTTGVYCGRQVWTGVETNGDQFGKGFERLPRKTSNFAWLEGVAGKNSNPCAGTNNHIISQGFSSAMAPVASMLP